MTPANELVASKIDGNFMSFLLHQTTLKVYKKSYENVCQNHQENKKEGKDQESIQSSTKPDPDTNGKMTTSKLDITNESQEVSPFPAGDLKASTNRRA